MDGLFINILNMSITAGWLILAVVLLRVLLKKAPKWINVMLWAFVGIRLVCPFAFESEASWIKNAEPVSENISENASKETLVDILGEQYEDIIVSDSAIGNNHQGNHLNQNNNVLNEGNILDIEDSNQLDSLWKNDNNIYLTSNGELIFTDGNSAYYIGYMNLPNIIINFLEYAPEVWICGICLMSVYCLVSFIRIKRRVAVSMRIRDNIYICDSIDTPFILGIIRPRIYIPSNVSEEEIDSIIAHEVAHIKRCDNWWKPLAFFILTVHWFNPLVWLAYILLCRDIELACDEKVIKNMDVEQKKTYSKALLSCSVSRKTFVAVAVPLAFGEVAVKKRIKSVLNYKKPTFWIIAVAAVISVVVITGLMTNPVKYEDAIDEKMDAFLSEKIIERSISGDKEVNYYPCENHKIIGVKNNGNETTIYAWVLFEGYTYDSKKIESVTGWHVPTVITIKTSNEGEYKLLEYWEPRDGSYYADDIRSKFPKSLHDKALDSQLYIKEQVKDCESQAYKYFTGEDNKKNEDSETSKDESGSSTSDKTDMTEYLSINDMYLIQLNNHDNICYFTNPSLSVKGYEGVYELSDSKLVLKFYIEELGGEITRVFRRDGESLVYDMNSSKLPNIANMMIKNGYIFLNKNSNMFDEEVAKQIGEGIMGHKEKYLRLYSKTYMTDMDNSDEEFYMGPTIYLNQLDKTFSYSSSVFSSYIMFGSYEYTGDRLILKADEYTGGETYAFKIIKGEVVFCLEESIINLEPPHSSMLSAPFILNEVYILQ